jgi:hypothetical protein
MSVLLKCDDIPGEIENCKYLVMNCVSCSCEGILLKFSLFLLNEVMSQFILVYELVEL